MCVCLIYFALLNFKKPRMLDNNLDVLTIIYTYSRLMLEKNKLDDALENLGGVRTALAFISLRRQHVHTLLATL